MFLSIAAVVFGEWQELPVLLKTLGSRARSLVSVQLFCRHVHLVHKDLCAKANFRNQVLGAHQREQNSGSFSSKPLSWGTKTLSTSHIFGVSVVISGGVLYGQAQQAHLAQATLSSIFHVPYTLSMASIDPAPEEMQQWTDISSVLSCVGHDFCC